MKKVWIIVVTFAVVLGAGFLFLNKEPEAVVANFKECVDAGNPIMESYPRQCKHGDTVFTEVILNTFEDKALGLSFEYPQTYFVALRQSSGGERGQYAIVLAEDKPEIREMFSNPKPGTEGPPTITVTIFQNNLDNYTLQNFVEGTDFSNFKMSDGRKTEITVGGETAWRYRATGLYENDNVVVVRPEYVYMFTAFFNSPYDQILKDSDVILKTVKFFDPEQNGNVPTSADNAPPGSIHNLPVPKAVTAVKAYVAEKSGVDQGLVVVLTAYEKEWSDGCLGLGGPAESCIAVITPGYEVTVQVKGTEQKFRTNTDGSVIRMEK